MLPLKSAYVPNVSRFFDDNSYSRKEFEYHTFQRSFNLNTDIVDHEQIKATYEAGILSVTLPKKEEAKPKPVRTIQIT